MISDVSKPHFAKLFPDIESAQDQAHKTAISLNLSIDLVETVRNELVDRHNQAYEFLYPIASNEEKSKQIFITILPFQN